MVDVSRLPFRWAGGRRQPRVRVAHDRCIVCGDCLDACPTDAITLAGSAGPVSVQESQCTGCRRCEKVCPVHALTVRGPVRSLPADVAHGRGGRAGGGEGEGSLPADGPPAPGGFDRRNFLTRAGVLGGGVAAGAVAGGAGFSAARAAPPGPRLPAVPFHGPHQAGVLTPAPPSAVFAVFDVTADGRAGLGELMRALTGVARQLTAGGTLPGGRVGGPPADTGTLGEQAPADGLTVTLGVGASLFDERFGLASDRPARLTPMPAFAGDDLDPGETGGDLVLQLRAGHTDTALRALRLIARATRGAMQPRYRIDGFIPLPTPSGSPRNLQGFKHGISNPDVGDPATASRLLWAGGAEPTWAAGGTYHVVRIIRMLLEPWERVALPQQEAIIGRSRDSGAPLDGLAETDVPRYGQYPADSLVPPGAHIRLANPRTADTADSQFLRVGYSYDRGIDARGGLDLGLIFNAFQQDPRRQFEAVQNRLEQGQLSGYVVPTGGGYFFTLPGVRDAGDWYARGLLS